MTFSAKYFVITISVLTLLIGCATPYQKKTMWDGLGYTDEKIEEGVYRVTYLVNAKTPSQDALKYWHMRAKELCGSDQYEHDARLSMRNNRQYNPALYSTQDHYFPYVEGKVTCKKKREI